MMDKPNQFEAEENQSQRVPAQPFNPQKNYSATALPPGWSESTDSVHEGLLMHFSEAIALHSYSLIRLLGYGLLGFALLDYIYIIVPPRLANPVWELQTIGSLVAHVVAPLLGLLLVLYRPQSYVSDREKKVLSFLSWISLVIGLLYLLMLPLGVIDTWRIYQYKNSQVNFQVAQQSQKVQRIKGQLKSATTDEQIKNLVASLTPQGGSSQVENPQQFKSKFLAEIAQIEQSIKTQAESVQASQQQQLLKNSVKWNLGALISGTLFMAIWYLTEWARIKAD